MPVIDYRSPETDRARVPVVVGWRFSVGIVVAIGMVFAFTFAGVASDRVSVPLPKKVVLTIGGVIAFIIVQLATIGRPAGCVTWATLYAMVIGANVLVMWYWN